MSNVGKWDKWYENVKNPEPYGDTETYKLGGEFLESCTTVEDWGCGKGWFRQFYKGNYVGLDGSHSKFADKIVDLAKYTSSVPGIYMRHVLEHNYEWEAILNNALDSFTERMCLVLFTPWPHDKTEQIAFVDSVGVPDMAFDSESILGPIASRGLKLFYQTIKSETFYGQETLFYIEK